jgi:cytochrome c biogenesis protein CcmG, thiol:disulfide interchange protein DsbE
VAQRPGFVHRPERRGLVGPFSGRQLLAAFLAVVVVGVILVAVTTPLGSTGGGPVTVDPRATQYIIGPAPEVGLQPGDTAPELEVALDDGSTYQLTDLDGRPIRLADLRGKAVWINFWASWCPPCQYETPIVRSMDEKYRDRGLEIIAVQVQQTVDAGRDYADRYGLEYTIGADVTGSIFHAYRVFALPTQFFIDPEGRIRTIVNGPLDEQRATQLIESILPPGSSAAPSTPLRTPDSTVVPARTP